MDTFVTIIVINKKEEILHEEEIDEKGF